jgi:DNA-binding FadR family transcriptional regulator
MTAPDALPRSTFAPSWTQRPANLAAALANELLADIVSGRHAPGSQLPPEPSLCEIFGVSRTVVREAMKLLQEKGLVLVRQGSGTVVTPPESWKLLDEQVLAASIAGDRSLTILDDLVVTRRLLESDMAHVAARAATAETIDRLGSLVAQMDRLVDVVGEYAEHDHAFHDLIMQASGNRIARAVVRALERQAENTARYVGHRSRDLFIASNRGHRAIYERIAARDAEGAEREMFRHITEAWLARQDGDAHRCRLAR